MLLWTAAAAIDYAGPGLADRERLRGLQRVAVAHFAERYGLFMIICLGESIVASAWAPPRALTAALVFGCRPPADHIGLWWTYFDRAAGRAEERLREHARPGARRRRRLQLHPPA